MQYKDQQYHQQKRTLPNVSIMEPLTRIQHDRSKFVLLLFFDIVNIAEIKNLLNFYDNLIPNLKKFNNVEILLINNQDRGIMLKLSQQQPFCNYNCYYDQGTFTQQLTNKKMLSTFPYCFVFSPIGEFLYEGNPQSKELFKLAFE